MKKSFAWWILLGLLVLATTIACKSTPPQTEETPPPPPAQTTTPAPNPDDLAPAQAAINQLNAEAERAAAARKLVVDFNGPTLFADDWNSADSLFSQAEQQKSIATVRTTRESTDRYSRATDALEALRDKTLNQNYTTKENDLVNARNAAIDAGAQDLVPSYLLDADNTVADAYTKYQANDYYGASDAAANGLTMYTALKTGLDAYKIRVDIANRDFEVYDPVNIYAADDTLRSAAADYENKNFSSAQTKCETAFASYTASLKTAWQSYAAEKGAAASAERQKALDLKANVAVRQDFNSAQDKFNQATLAFQNKQHEQAASLYMDSQSMFTVIAQAALEKQQAAQDALDRANQKMQDSDDQARNAEAILQGGM